MFSLATWVTLFQRAVMQGVPILFGATGEILTEKSGNLNLGIPGIMYVGGISGVIGSFLYEQHVTELNPFLAVLIPLICTLFGSLLMGLLYCFLTVTLRANQNVPVWPSPPLALDSVTFSVPLWCSSPAVTSRLLP